MKRLRAGFAAIFTIFAAQGIPAWPQTETGASQDESASSESCQGLSQGEAANCSDPGSRREIVDKTVRWLLQSATAPGAIRKKDVVAGKVKAPARRLERCIANKEESGLTIRFDPGSSGLLPTSNDQLDVFVVALKAQQVAGKSFFIVGHADSTGRWKPNMSLSQQRADAVAGYLAGKGIERKLLFTAGFGESQPVVCPGSNPVNRRVTIVMLAEGDHP